MIEGLPCRQRAETESSYPSHVLLLLLLYVAYSLDISARPSVCGLVLIE